MKIKSFKLITGEEVVGNVVEEGADFFQIEKIRQLGLAQVEVPGEAQPRLIPHFVPWILTNADGKIKLNKNNVMADVDNLPAELEALYLQQTTGLDLSSKLPGSRR